MSAYSARVIVASTRASTGVYEDRSGPIAVESLIALGFSVAEPTVVPDGPQVESALRAAVADGIDLVVTSGGTGLSPADRTPEATRAVIDFEVPGIAERLRADAWATLPTAALSRGFAGVAGRTLIVNLPGSTGGVRDGMRVLNEVAIHAIDQLRGGDHERPDHH